MKEGESWKKTKQTEGVLKAWIDENQNETKDIGDSWKINILVCMVTKLWLVFQVFEMLPSMPKREIFGNLQLEQFLFSRWCQIYGWYMLLPSINVISIDWWRGFEKLLITIAARGKVEVMKRKLQWTFD